MRRCVSLIIALAAILGLCSPARAYDVIAVAMPGCPGDSLRAVVAAPSGTPPAEGRPSLYMLNGYSGSHLDWAKRVNIDSIAQARGLVLVFPDGGNSWYIDTPGNPIESAITGPLVSYVDSLYHTADSPRRRAVAGLSMGGHGAVRLAGRHPELFGAVAAMSGALDLATNPAIRKRYGLAKVLGPYDADPQKWRRESATAQVEALRDASTPVLLICGDADFFLSDNRRFAQLMQAAGADCRLDIRPGDHNWRFWRAQLPAVLDFVCQSLSAPAAR